MIDLPAFGLDLRIRRGSRGLREVAREIGISYSTLSRMERGRRADVASIKLAIAWLGAGKTQTEPAVTPAQPPPAPCRVEPHPDLASLIMAAYQVFLTLDADGHQ